MGCRRKFIPKNKIHLLCHSFNTGTTFINPSTHGIRILMSAWLLFGLVVVAEYTGHLTAAFAVLPEPRLFKNLRQILDHPQYQIGIVKGAITSMLLQVCEKVFIRRALCWAQLKADGVSGNVSSGRYEIDTHQRHSCLFIYLLFFKCVGCALN